MVEPNNECSLRNNRHSAAFTQPNATADSQLPRSRPKSRPVRDRLLDRDLLVVQRPRRRRIAPPARERGRGQVQRGDDDDGADGQADIESRRSDVVVAHPPAAVAVADVFLENKSDDGPRQLHRVGRRLGTWTERRGIGRVGFVAYVAQRRGGRKLTHAAEEDGRAEEPDL